MPLTPQERRDRATARRKQVRRFAEQLRQAEQLLRTIQARPTPDDPEKASLFKTLLRARAERVLRLKLRTDKTPLEAMKHAKKLSPRVNAELQSLHAARQAEFSSRDEVEPRTPLLQEDDDEAMGKAPQLHEDVMTMENVSEDDGRDENFVPDDGEEDKAILRGEQQLEEKIVHQARRGMLSSDNGRRSRCGTVFVQDDDDGGRGEGEPADPCEPVAPQCVLEQDDHDMSGDNLICGAQAAFATEDVGSGADLKGPDGGDNAGETAQSPSGAQDITPETGPEGSDTGAKGEIKRVSDETYELNLLGPTITSGVDGGFLHGFPERWGSWESFEREFKQFTAERFMLFFNRSSNTVGHRNMQIKKRKIPEEHKVYYPMNWHHYTKTLMCTHGDKYRARGKGERIHTKTRKTKCTAKVIATMQRSANGWYLFVKARGYHNHAVSSTLWMYYTENRRIQDPLVLEQVDVMRRSGAKTRGILQYLRKQTGQLFKLKDVHNIVQGLKLRANREGTDGERAEAVLKEFCEEDEGNMAQIHVDGESNVAQVVCFQSARMKRLFLAYPEVVMIDTTHNTNVNRYKLFSFVVHDVFGKGQYVFHSLVASETKANLRVSLDAFKEHNPQWGRIQVVVSDKAFHEKDVLQQKFPQARQLLCQFHVIEWLHKKVAQLGTGNKEAKDKLKGVMSALMYARSEADYNEQKAYFLDLLGGDKEHPLYTFFMVNWDPNKAEWSTYLRGDIPHLRNNTNNRVEAKWGAIKQVVNKTFTIDEVLAMLICLQSVAEEAYIDEMSSVKTQLTTTVYEDLYMPELQLSPHAFAYVKQEYTFAMSPGTSYEMDMSFADKLILRWPGNREEHTITLETNTCDCVFMRTLLLPCRHVMWFRRENGNKPIVPPVSSLASRWIVKSPQNDIDSGLVATGGIRVETVEAPAQQGSAMESAAMYSQAGVLLSKIREVMAEQSTPTFKLLLQWLQLFYDRMMEGNVEAIPDSGLILGLTEASGTCGDTTSRVAVLPMPSSDAPTSAHGGQTNKSQSSLPPTQVAQVSNGHVEVEEEPVETTEPMVDDNEEKAPIPSPSPNIRYLPQTPQQGVQVDPSAFDNMELDLTVIPTDLSVLSQAALDKLSGLEKSELPGKTAPQTARSDLDAEMALLRPSRPTFVAPSEVADTKASRMVSSGHTAANPFTFATPPHIKGLTAKAKKSKDRADRIKAVRRSSRLACQGKMHSLVKLMDVDLVLDAPYSWVSVVNLVNALELPPENDVGELVVVGWNLNEPVPSPTVLPPLTRIVEALKAIEKKRHSSTPMLAHWSKAGMATEDQLEAMQRVHLARTRMRTVVEASAWVDTVTWKAGFVVAPFNDTQWVIKKEHKANIGAMNLGTSLVGGEMLEGSLLLAFRENMWLNTTCMVAGMMVLRQMRSDIGVVSPSYHEFVARKERLKVANAFHAFDPQNKIVIGCVNISGWHWCAFHVDRHAQVCHLFDPKQNETALSELQRSVESVVEPLMHACGEFEYHTVRYCEQQDGNSCGVWCLAVLELTIAGADWSNSLYELVPYLRMRYLSKVTELLAPVAMNLGPHPQLP